MIEHHHSLRDVERMMIRHGNDAGAELDALGALGCCDQEHLRRRDCLPACRMMLADPKFVVLVFVEQLREFEVALKLERWMLTDWMMWCEKDAKAKPLVHLLLA